MALTKRSTGSVAWGESDIPTGWREADTAFMELPETASPQQLFRSLKKDLRLQEEGLALLTVSALQHQPTRFSRLVEIHQNKSGTKMRAGIWNSQSCERVLSR